MILSPRCILVMSGDSFGCHKQDKQVDEDVLLHLVSRGNG